MHLRSIVSLIALTFFAAQAEAADFKRLYATKATASSYLQNNWNRFTENYHPSYALDDNPKTAWVEGDDGNGEGAALTIGISLISSARALKLRLRNGYQKSKKLFSANAAPKTVEIALLGSGGQVLHATDVKLANKRGWQDVVVKPVGKRGFSQIRLTLKSVYPGRVYKDTCLSDVQIFVDSDVPYNKKAEEAKRDALRGWIAQRVRDAKFFAKLPPAYPFASTHFASKGERQVTVMKSSVDWVDKPVTDKNLLSVTEQVRNKRYSKTLRGFFDADARALIEKIDGLARDKGKAKGGRLHRATVKDPVRLPDGLWVRPRMALDYLDRGRVSFFEGKGASYDYLALLKRKQKKRGRQAAGPDGYLVEVSRKWRRGHPRVKWTTVGGKKKLSEVYAWEHTLVEERSVYETDTHCLFVYGAAERLERFACRTEDQETAGYVIVSLKRGADHKIERWVRTSGHYEGPNSPESPGENNRYLHAVSVVKAKAVASK